MGGGFGFGGWGCAGGWLVGRELGRWVGGNLHLVWRKVVACSSSAIRWVRAIERLGVLCYAGDPCAYSHCEILRTERAP